MIPGPTQIAGTICPACLSPADSSRNVLSGFQACVKCGVRYEAAVFPLPEPPRGPASLITGDGSSPCAVHTGNVAEVSCERCGRLMCSLCRVDSDGKVLCTKCFERLAFEGALPSAVNKITSHLAKARQYTLVSWLMYPLAPILGPYAFYLSIRAWVERSLRSE